MSLEAQNLACIRGERLVFRALNFALSPGEALLLEGPNGSGKSSLLRLLAGFLTPAEGRIAWRGADALAEPDPFRREIAFLGHLDAVKPILSVAENLRFWARLEGLSGSAAIEAALRRLGLDDLAFAPARLLSAGQRRRLNLARLLLTRKSLWLLDEPTVSLDRDAVSNLAAIMAEHRAGGGMIIAATHLDLGLHGAARLGLGASA